MKQEMANFSITPPTERKRSCSTIWSTILILFSLFGFSFSSLGQGVNIDQGANGALGSLNSPVVWQNGDLNVNNSHYVEGHSVPYRLIMTNLPHSGTDTITLTMNFDITQSNAYALDFITGDSNLTPHAFANHSTPESVDPLTGVSGVANTPDYLRVSIPDFLANNPGIPGATNALNHFKSICNYSGTTPVGANNERNSISLFGGTFVQSFGVVYGYDAANVLNLAAGNQTVSFTVKFVPAQATVVMAWGGHISRFIDWGGNKTAALINGSPYHMRTQSWGPNLGNIGNMDRALKASMALIPPVCPGDLNPPISLCANAQGAPISCPVSACAGSTLYYKVPQDAKATTFNWYVTPSTGVTITPQVADPNDSFVAITFANSGSYTVNVVISNTSTFLDTCSQGITINPVPNCSITGNNSICSTDSTSFSGPAGMDSYSWTGPAGFTAHTQSTGTIKQQGTYFLTVTKDGCSSTCQRDLLVNLSAPPPNATPGSRCGPGVVTLTAIPNGSYDSVLWYSDAANTQKVASGLTYSPNLQASATFYALVVNSIGCSSLSAPAKATINPLPTAPVPSTSGSGDTRCDTGVVNLHASSSDTSCKIIFWFADSARTMPLATGPDYSPHLLVTTTFWVACQNSDSCFGASVPVKGTVNPKPAAPTTTPAARCGAGVVTLGASGSGNCDSLIWYSDAGLTTRVNVGSSYAPNISATTTYWVVCKSNKGCVSPPATVVGTINPVPAAPTTTPAARCGAGVVTLGASGSANCDSLIWFSDAAMTTRVNVGSSYSPSLSATTTFWVICKSVNGCIGGPTTVVGTVNPIPTAPTTTPAARCGTGVVTLGASGSANCDSLIWFSDAAMTTRVNVGSSYSPSLSATTTFWVICKSVNGCIGGPTTVVGTVNPVPAAPTTTPAARCGTGVVTLGASGSANCDSLIWFSDAAMTTRVNVGSSYSPSLSATTTFWVICKSVNGCIGGPTTVVGTINPIPAAPTTTPAARCGTGVVTLGASGSANCDSLIWFSDAAMTTRVNVGSSYNPSLSATTTFWVICKSVNGCIGGPTTVVGTVNPIPAAPTTTPAARCGAGVVTLGASGSANCDSLIWFSNAAMTTRVNVGSSYSPSLSATTTFWVICKSVNGCIGGPTTVVGTINPIPAAPTTTPAARCGTGVVTLGASGSANCDSLIWFSDAAMTTRVNVGSSYSPSLSATTTFWVICKSVNGCIGGPTTVVGTVNPIPAAPTTTPAARCGQGPVTLGASGSANCDSLIWFSDAALTTRVNVGSSYSPTLSATTTFWVICKSVNGCVSTPATVVGTVNPGPAMPTTTPAARCGAGVVTLGASGSANCDSLIWFSDAAMTTRVNVGNSYSPTLSATTTFWVVCKSAAGCTSGPSTVVGTVNPIPSAPTTTPAARCGTGVVTLGASGSANCDSLIWFSAADLSTRVNVGSSYSPTLSATTTFWVICKSANGCVSTPTTVVGTVNPIPSAPTTTPAARCGTGVVTLGASGSANCDSLIWFSDVGLTTRVNVGSSYSPTLSATTTFWVICKSVNGCTSSATTVIGTVNPIPAAPTVTPAAHCGPGVATMMASGGANCDSLLWFDGSNLINRVNAGSSYSPNLSSTTTFWVICKSLNGCLSTPAMVTDTTDPVPTLQLSPVQVCQGSKITLTGSPAGGSWFSPQLGSLAGGIFDAALVSTGVYKIAYTFTNQYGCAKTDSLTLTVTNCGPITCSYTQGYYGGNGKACDGDTTWISPIAFMNHLLTTDMIIGIGPKTILIPIGSGATVNAVMPGNTTPRGLTYVGQCTISTATGSCFVTNYLTSKGKINNVLLGQTIALSFNSRMKGGILLNVPIQAGYIVTQSTTGCGKGASVVTCSTSSSALSQQLVPASVANYLSNFGANSATVGDLLTLANQVLGGSLTPGQPGANNNTVPSYSDVNDAVSAINQAFDECDLFVGYNLPLCPPLVKQAAPTSVNTAITAGQFTVYPNPTHGMFTVESPANLSNTVITVLDVNGRVVAKQNVDLTGRTVFNLKNVTAGVYVVYISNGLESFHIKIMVL